MKSTVLRLETNAEALWARWIAARTAHMDAPTPARLDACIEAFKPYYLRAVGRKGLEDALAEERRRCNAFLVAAGRRVGGRHASPP